MKFKSFHDRSLIMGTILAAQSLQGWMKTNLKNTSGLSFLGSLILISLYFEENKKGISPSRLAQTLGYSKSRVSQEISFLNNEGYVRRNLSNSSARSIFVCLTSAGERKSSDLIKGFSRLQSLIDRVVGERQAESINKHLLLLRDHLEIA